MTCEAVQIQVESVRWPVQRYSSQTASYAGSTVSLPSTADCISRGTCSMVDATIWLIPKCTDPSLPPEMCSNVAVGTNCFPFCMAARVSATRNTSPVFVNAGTWRTGKQLLDVDCALASATASSTQSSTFTSASVTTSSYAAQTYSAAQATALFVTPGSSTQLGCVAGTKTTSWVPKPTSETVVPFILEAGQPFAVTGDTILIPNPQADGGMTVMVERLTGDQNNVFTLQRMWNNLPAAPTAMVPIQTLQFDYTNSLFVPQAYQDGRILSTASQNYVFYAVSPPYNIFSAYLNYCRDKSVLPQFQFLIESSYGPLRIFRVSAYCEGACAQLSSQFTFDSFAGNGVFTSATFNCSRHYNATITSLEYVNEQNIAVTVQVADHTFNPSTLTGPGSTYTTYWLNPANMAIRTDQLWPTATTTASNTSACATQETLPKLGSLLAEVLNAGIFVVEMGVGAVVYTPGMVRIWRGGGVCPLQARGHSVLATCGASVYSLEDYFDSVDDATSIFWGILSFVEDALGGSGNSTTYHPLQNILAGMVVYGKARISFSSVKSVEELFKFPIEQEVKGLWAAIRTHSVASTAGTASSAATSMGRFTARVATKVGVDIVSAVLVDVAAVTASSLWRGFVNNLYDHRSDFDALVTSQGSAACEGLKTMFGEGNPWSNLIGAQCLSIAYLSDGMMQLTLNVFVDVPMVRCVCKDSAGQNQQTFALTQCLPNVPTSLAPVLIAMVDATLGKANQQGLLCPSVLAYTNQALSSSMDPWFEQVYAGLDALGDSVDYALIGFDSDAGQCLNFQQNPNVVVIIPDPIDYFQGCSRTTSCQSKCSSEWSAFSVALQGGPNVTGTATIATTTRSLFFPTSTKDMVVAGPIQAITQPSTTCGYVCQTATDQCVAIAVLVGSQLQVQYFCIPISTAQSVYSTTNSTANWASDLGGSALQVAFLDQEGASLAILATIPSGTAVYTSSRANKDALLLNITTYVPSTLQELSAFPGAIQQIYYQGNRPIQLVDFMVVQDKLLVNIAVRAVTASGFQPAQQTIWLDPSGSTMDQLVTLPSQDLWRNYQPVQYFPAAKGVCTLLLWPSQNNPNPPQTLVVSWQTGVVTVSNPVPLAWGQSLASQASTGQTKMVLSKNLRQDIPDGTFTIFAASGSTYDWLSLFVVSYAGTTVQTASASNAQSVPATVTVTTSCDGTDCRSCPTLQLRALCSAYQSCAVYRCIGTPINQKRPLCGVGMVLRSTGMLSVQTMQGAWSIFVQMFGILLKLDVERNVPGVDISWPDDAFYGYMCAAKDTSAEFFSILTSGVNSALQQAQVPAPTLLTFANVDANANAVLSMTTTSVTSFLHQGMLWPLYVMAIGERIMTCEVNGMLAVVNSSGFTVNLVSASLAASTGAITGRCLTQNDLIQAQQTGDSTTASKVASVAADTLTTAADLIALSTLDPIMHALDGALAFASGLVGKFGDVLQSFDLRHCVLPDASVVTMAQVWPIPPGTGPLGARYARACARG